VAEERDDAQRTEEPTQRRLDEAHKKGEVVTKHPYIPTDEQQEAMDKFVNSMDLMHAGEKDEEGYRILSPYFFTPATTDLML